MAQDRTILCLGDSNTHGTCPMADLADSRRFPHDVRWPGVFAASLGPGWHVIEEGHPGRTTVHPDPIEGDHKNALMVLPALLESHRPIDLVAMMLGTNDLKARFSVTAFDISLAVERLIQVILNSGAGPEQAAPQVLVVSPPPIVEIGILAGMFSGGAEKSTDLASLYRAAAERNRVAAFDAGAVIQSDPHEGIHFDEVQHERLGKALAEVVRDMMASG